MRRKLLLLCMAVITLVTIGFIALIADITWDQYQDTKEWEDTSLGEDLSQVPPFLARNYVRAEDKEALQVWSRVGRALTEIDANGGIEPSRKTSYESLLEDSVTWQETYEITEGDVAVQNERLRLYLEIEDALETVYASPETETLQALTNRLYNLEVDTHADVHTVYLDKLSQVARDYSALSSFLADSLPDLGTIEDKTLTVNIDIGPKNTEKLITEIEANGLQKFPFVDQIYGLLTGEDWDTILERNAISREYQKWQDAKAALEALSKSDYYNVSIITTYRQALDAGLETEVAEKDGYTIDPNSPVESVSYNGKPLAEDRYVRYGTPVVVSIKEIYVELPKEEIPPEETPDPPETEAPEGPDDGWDEDWDTEEPQAPEGPDDGWTEEW